MYGWRACIGVECVGGVGSGRVSFIKSTMLFAYRKDGVKMELGCLFFMFLLVITFICVFQTSFTPRVLYVCVLLDATWLSPCTS